MNLHYVDGQPNIQAKRIENLTSGTDRSEASGASTLDVRSVEAVEAQVDANNVAPIGVAQSNGLDVNALLDGIAQGQTGDERQKQGQSADRVGSGVGQSSDVGGDIANQIAGGGSPSINQILNGFGQPSQNAPANLSTIQGQGQNAEGVGLGANGENQAGSQAQGSIEGQGVQGNGGNLRTIQLLSTVISEVNGLQHATEIILDLGAGQAQTAVPINTSPAEVPQVGNAQPLPTATPEAMVAPGQQLSSKAAHTVSPIMPSMPSMDPMGMADSTVCPSL